MSAFLKFIAIATLCLALSPVAAEEIQDATIAAPEAHSVVMENDHVRVISALASAGHKSPMHTHPPLVLISLDTARIKLINADGGEQIANLRPGMVIWRDGGAHKWELLAGEVNVIAVVVKAARTAAAKAGDQ